MDCRTITQLVACLKTGDWVSEHDVLETPHFDKRTAIDTLNILFYSGLLRRKETFDDTVYQWIIPQTNQTTQS